MRKVTLDANVVIHDLRQQRTWQLTANKKSGSREQSSCPDCTV
jgi:hypothetical protein